MRDGGAGAQLLGGLCAIFVEEKGTRVCDVCGACVPRVCGAMHVMVLRMMRCDWDGENAPVCGRVVVPVVVLPHK